MPADAYYAGPVQSLARDGVFAGTLCDEGFCPAEPLDRKTMAVWIVRMLDGADPPPVVQTRFDDVDAGGFHAPFIERMAALGVTSGCGDGSRFCPDSRVSRAQMAVFLSRAYDLPDGQDPGFTGIPGDAWYAEEVARLAASGITVGCGDGTEFCPDRDATRAQMATFLWRATTAEDDTSPPVASALGESVSVGPSFSCAVRADHTIECWGDAPAPPSGRFLTVSTGQWFACGVRTDQSVTCWRDIPIRISHLSHDLPPGYYVSVSAPQGGVGRPCGGLADQTFTCVTGEFLTVSTSRTTRCGVHIDRSVTCWELHFGRDGKLYRWLQVSSA